MKRPTVTNMGNPIAQASSDFGLPCPVARARDRASSVMRQGRGAFEAIGADVRIYHVDDDIDDRMRVPKVDNFLAFMTSACVFRALR